MTTSIASRSKISLVLICSCKMCRGTILKETNSFFITFWRREFKCRCFFNKTLMWYIRSMYLWSDLVKPLQQDSLCTWQPIWRKHFYCKNIIIKGHWFMNVFKKIVTETNLVHGPWPRFWRFMRKCWYLVTQGASQRPF